MSWCAYNCSFIFNIKKGGLTIKKLKIVFISIVIVIALIVVASFIYVNIYYKASPEAIEASNNATLVDGDITFYGDKKIGFIIYTGGKVEEKAYSLLAKEINDKGYFVSIAKAPFRLNIINPNRADTIIQNNLDIKQWIIIGHSLGGTSASMYADKNSDKLKGLVFLGSYPYTDLSKTDLKVLNIRASNDEIINKQAAEKTKLFYPKETKNIIINGGNHAGFGSYGEQKGDGIADISSTEQLAQTVKGILDYIKDIEK